MVTSVEQAAAEATAASAVPEGTSEVRWAIEYGRRLLFAALDGLDGDKTIVWDRDRSLMHRVNLFAGASLLSSHGVVANHGIETRRAAETPHVVFFLSPTATSLDLLCDYIDNVKNDSKALYQVFFIPDAWYVVREKLKERSGGRYWERLESVREIPLCWLPRDGECLSLSQPQLPSRLLLNGDWTLLHKCAVALNQLVEQNEAAGGRTTPRKVAVFSRGKWSQDIARMLQKLRTASAVRDAVAEDVGVAGRWLKVNRIVLIDRWLDPLTPMLTQLTYAGLVDEVYGVGMVNSVKVPQGEFEEKEGADPFAQKEIYLTDEVFHRLKHSHINAFAREVAAILTELRKDETFDKEKMSVAEYALLVKKMPRILKRKSHTSTHMRLAEMSRAFLYRVLSENVKVEKELLEASDGDKVVPFIEEAVYEATDLNRVLRLIAVHSITAGGLKPAVLNTYRRIVTHSYGTSALNKLLKMQKMGLVRERGGTGRLACDYPPLLYAQMRKQYNQLPANVSETTSADAAYAYSGFAPLLVRVLEEGDRLRWVGWHRCDDVAGGNGRHSGGAVADGTAGRKMSLTTTAHDVVDALGSSEVAGIEDDATVVFIVGGATRAELAAIRTRLPNVALVATTALISGNGLLDNITSI